MEEQVFADNFNDLQRAGGTEGHEGLMTAEGIKMSRKQKRHISALLNTAEEKFISSLRQVFPIFAKYSRVSVTDDDKINRVDENRIIADARKIKHVEYKNPMAFCAAYFITNATGRIDKTKLQQMIDLLCESKRGKREFMVKSKRKTSREYEEAKLTPLIFPEDIVRYCRYYILHVIGSPLKEKSEGKDEKEVEDEDEPVVIASPDEDDDGYEL